MKLLPTFSPLRRHPLLLAGQLLVAGTLAAQDQITTVDGQTYNVLLERIDESEFTLRTFSSRQYRNVPTDLVRTFYSDQENVVAQGSVRVPWLAEMRVAKKQEKALSGDIAILSDPRYVVERTEEYVELVAYYQSDTLRPSPDSLRVVTRLRLGIDDGLGVRSDVPIRDRAGRIRTFDSPVAALNFMNALGWRLLVAYRQNKEGTERLHYVLRRSVPKGQYQNVPR